MHFEKLSPGPGMAAEEVRAHQRARIQGALIELVAEHGYNSLKVRDLVKLAEVSSRAFYENFGSKEECFLRTHEFIARRATREIVSAQIDEADWRERPRLVYMAFARELQRDPAAARLILVEGNAAGPAALKQSRRFEETLSRMLGESFAREPGGVRIPDLVVEGIVAGIGRVARTRLLTGKDDELIDLGGDLMNWALSFPGKYAAELDDLDRQSVWSDTRLRSSGAAEQDGDRSLILSATAKLGPEDGYRSLNVSRICRAAGVPRKVFKSHFDDVEDCFRATLELHIDRALSESSRAQAAGSTWTGSTYRTITALCDELHEDPFLAAACLSDAFVPGISAVYTRRHLITAIEEQLHGAPPDRRPEPLAAEASIGSVWSILFHHVIRAASRARRPRVSATLAYLTVAPAVGGPDAVDRIRREQIPQR